jgi:hypothetical protein
MCDRWISDTRLCTIDHDTSDITDVYEYLDFFIDAFLYNLPIPRFSRTFDAIRYKNSIKSMPAFYEPDAKPDFITVLRDNSLGQDVHVYVVILMILDIKTLADIPIQVAYESNFVKCAKECLSEEFKVEYDSLLDLLQKFQKYMITGNLDQEDVTFLRMKDIDHALLSDTYVKAYEAFLEEDPRGFSQQFMRERCYVRNLVDELPEFRLF